MSSRFKANWQVNLFFAVSVGLLVLSGCGGSTVKPVKLAPVSGILRHNGKPIDGAYVKFMQKDCPIVAGGVTDKDGNFVITAFKPGDGAPIGENLIIISVPSQETAHRREIQSEVEAAFKITDPEAQGKKLMEIEHKTKNPFAKGRVEVGSKPKIPQKYAVPDSSGLKFTVKEGEKNLCQLELEG